MKKRSQRGGRSVDMALHLIFGSIAIFFACTNTLVAQSNLAVRFSESFDSVTAPALPAGWTTSTSGSGVPFTTASAATYVDTPPNAMHTASPATPGLSELTSPSILLSALPSRLIFKNMYMTEAKVGYDGGVLEISIDGGAFQDIIAAGGAFSAGGYNQAIASDAAGNPLIGRQAWTGIVENYVTTVVNLPSSALGHSIRLKWRYGTDEIIAGTGWWIDTVQIEDLPATTVFGFTENFDSVTAPALPTGWTTVSMGVATPFVTRAVSPDTPPNTVFTPNPANIGGSELVSPQIRVGGNSPKLIFKHQHAFESTFDGAVLEIKIGNGEFQDIITAGGTFLSGPYNATINPNFGNPLAGRRAWSGTSQGSPGFITTEVNLPPAAYRQVVQFKWRFGSDNVIGAAGWKIDTIQVTNAISGENESAITIPDEGPASVYPSAITISEHDGLISSVQVNLQNFSHTSPDDVDLMLVSPSGRKVILMSDVGGANAVSNLSISFDDSASASMPDSNALSSGVYRPTDMEPGDSFPSPAPPGPPIGKTLSSLNGTTANGMWRLFLVDDAGNNAGSISGGWNLVILSSPDVISLAGAGAAKEYPSEFTVAGLAGSITRTTVSISNFSHTSPDDVDIMLVAPSGRRIVLMSDVGGGIEVGGVNLTFDDSAGAQLSDDGPIVSGTYIPTNFEPDDLFPPPAPGGPLTGSALNAFYGSAPNGVWKLYAVDDEGNGVGSIAGGWSVTLQTSITACLFTISPGVQAFPISGGSGGFNIAMPLGCSWSASSASSFITLLSATAGDGSGTVKFDVGQNQGAARTGNIVVTNGVETRSFQVQQGSGCPTSLSASVANFRPGGGNGSIGVTAGSICSWNAAPSASWIHVTSAPQSGSGTATFTVDAHTGTGMRTATITIGAQTVTVNQSAPRNTRFDFDGDGKADVSIYRPADGNWWILNSSEAGGHSSAQFGNATDVIVPADYDGDGKTDIAVYRSGTWYILESETGAVRSVSWGTAGDIPTPNDFDGDNVADIAVFRPSNGTWFLLKADGTYTSRQFGQNGDIPVAADYDGDGRADYSVYRPALFNESSSWLVLFSSTNQSTQFAFGTTGDIPVPGDYDGDRIDDIAVYRPSSGQWYTSLTAGPIEWGNPTDKPAPADFDGDGKTDIAVYRNGTWYILRQATGAFNVVSWGQPGDRPTPSTYAP